MKNFALLLLICPMIVLSQNYNSGYSEGYKKGYCFEDFGCIAPIPPIAPIPTVGFDTYQDGYNKGFSDGKAAKKSSKSNSSTSSQANSLPKFERNYTSNSSGAYSNPTVVTDNSGAVVANAAADAGANIAGALIGRVKRNIKNDVVVPLKINLNAYKYIVFNNVDKEGGKAASRSIINKVKKRLIKSGYEVIDIVNKNPKKNDPLPDDLKNDSSLGLYASVWAKDNFDGVQARLKLYDSDENLVFEKVTVNFMTGGVADRVSSEIVSINHKYDPNLEKYLPIIFTEEEKIAKQRANDLEKELALNEIKRLKELLDLELISKDEYENKTKALKEVILK